MPSTLTESIELLKGIRAENGAAVAHLNDQELADLVHQQTGDERMLPAARSNSLQRGINSVGQTFKEAGQLVEGAIASPESPYPQRLAGRVAGNLVSGIPELGAGIAAASTRGIARPVLAALGGTYVYGRNKAETGDSGAALGESTGFLASLAGGVAGGRAAANLATSPVGQKVAGAAGSIVGSMPGDYLGMVTQPGETMDLKQLRSDDLGIPAYFLGQVAADPFLHVADVAGTKMKEAVEATKAKTPKMADVIKSSAADEYAALSKKPLADLTEIESARKVELGKKLAAEDEKLLAAMRPGKPVDPAALLGDEETPATITAQLNQLNAGKRAAVELPKGSTLAVDDLPDIQLHFKKHTSEDGTSYIYDENKTSPGMIDNARRTDSLGLLFGYGVPSVPKAPSGEIAVLRNRKGVEKTSVILDEATKPTVLESLRKLAIGEDDTVSIESPQQVLAWRKSNKGLQRLYSIASGEGQSPQSDISFTNHVLDMFQSATQTKIKGYKQKGPKFQPDATGAINGTGILKAIKDWAPGELYAHYQERGIETLLSNNKVPMAEFTKWLRENTPEVEVKKLIPYVAADVEQHKSRIAHEFETRGYVIDVDDHSEAFVADRNGDEVARKDLPPDLLAKFDLYDQIVGGDEDVTQKELGVDTDAATGRYGVEPKSLDQMPGAVDILVRVPARKFPPEASTRDRGNSKFNMDKQVYVEDPLFRGPHFGDSDVNVLASIRGYMETLPTGEKVFHVFEVQSDWGQRMAKDQKTLAAMRAKSNDPKAKFTNMTADHPLLSHYETLALKTAIQHARSEGATKIAISDAETAMMTEGHDRAARAVRAPAEFFATRDEAKVFLGKLKAEGKDGIDMRYSSGEWLVSWNEGYSRPSQEPGMRAAYDERLPAIMKKLTGDKGGRADFGGHAKVQVDEMLMRPELSRAENVKSGAINGSPVFKNADGTGKSNITARLYDITNPRPEVRRLFSLYDADAQASFESALRRQQDEVDSGRRPAEELSREQVLERAIGGNLAKLDPLLNFLNAVKGTRGAIRSETFANPSILASVDLADGSIALNREARLSVTQAFAKLAHEQGHLAVHELPTAVKQALVSDTKNLGTAGRRGILEEVKSALKLGADFDTGYLAGEKFDPADPHYDLKVMHEFTGGLLEAAAHSHAQSIPTGWMAYLPVSVRKLLTRAISSMKKLFGDDYPSLGAMLSGSERNRLNRIVEQMQAGAVDAEQVNLRSLLKLQSSDKFNEARFIDGLAADGEQFALQSGPGELHSFASDLYSGAKKAVQSRYENLFFAALFRAKTKPETAGHFWALHNFRPSNKSDEHSYLAFLGQDKTEALSREQAVERWAKFFDDTVLDTGPKGEKWRNAFGDINEENQNRREASQVPLTEADLISPKEMVEKYGMTEEQAEFARRLIKSSELVAQEHIRKGEQEDITNLTRAFYGVNKAQDIEGVRQKVARISRIMRNAGDNRYQLVAYRDQLDRMSKLDSPDMDAQAELGLEVQNFAAKEESYKQLLDANVRQEFAGAIAFRDGPDSFISSMGEMMIRLASLRARERRITASAGWASMTRRGRFRIRVKDESPLGAEFGRVLEYRGFQSEGEMKKYIAEKGYKDSQIKTFDMNEVKERVRAYTPSGLQKAHDLAKKQLGETLAEIQSKASGLDPATQDVLSNVIHDIQASFRPVAQELADAISVKGDKFGQRRYNIAGFNKNDFLPNLFEYMQMRTVGGNKGLAKAESDLQISRRELDSQPELRERMLKEQQYVLGAQTEWNLAKKSIFYYYLGANFRHVIQNSVQIPLNGVSQMVAEGHGLRSYKHFAEAAKLSARYNYKGTTGDKSIDVLLKQAEKDGVSFSTAIEAPLHEGDTLQNVLDSINANSDGKVGFGQKVGLAGTRIVRGVEKFLQATSEAAESANRKTTFIASVLAERSKGNSDLASLYERASQFTNFVNFVGDKPNRPGYMVLHGNTPLHGPLGLVSALQSFTLNHISQLYSFYKNGWEKGSKVDKQAFVVGVTHLLAFAGSMGFVGMSTAEQLIEEVTGKSLRTLYREGLVTGLTGLSDDEETKESLRSTADRIADTTMYGFPALAGVDVSNNIGLGSPFIRYQSGKALGVEEFGGAGVGMVGRIAQEVGKVAADPFNPQAWWSATRSASPSFLANAIKTYELLNEGSSLDANSQPVGDPLGVGGSAAALAGFTPMETAKQRDFNNRVYKVTKKSAGDYQRTVLNISQALSDHERTGNPDSLLHANEMFAKYLESVSGLQDRDSMISSITEQVRQNAGKQGPKPSLKLAPEINRLEAAFPSVKRPSPNSLDALLSELGIAQSLGQDDVLFRKAQSLPQTLQRKVLSDALAQAGLTPEEVQGLISPQSAAHLGLR